MPQPVQLPRVWVESSGAVGAGTQTITGAFDAPYQRALEAIQERRSAGTLRKNGKDGGMVEVLYPGGASEPVVGISKNLRPNREPGPTDIYSQEALTKISEALKKGDHRWHPPGQCGLCDAIRAVGSTATRVDQSSIAFPVRRDGRLYPWVRPQCESCRTLNVQDLFERTIFQQDVGEGASGTLP